LGGGEENLKKVCLLDLGPSVCVERKIRTKKGGASTFDLDQKGGEGADRGVTRNPAGGHLPTSIQSPIKKLNPFAEGFGAGTG